MLTRVGFNGEEVFTRQDGEGIPWEQQKYEGLHQPHWGRDTEQLSVTADKKQGHISLGMTDDKG